MSLKVGIYIPEYNPESGGASSLTKTIQQEILLSHDENKYVFIYEGSINKRKSYLLTRENFDYININQFRFLNTKLRFIKKVLRKLKSIFRCNNVAQKDNSFNCLAKTEDIDIFYFTTPVCVDIDYPYIYTVWDLGHRTTPFFPEVSRAGWTWQSREETYQKMFYKASYVLTGNQEGKKEILTNYSMPENKIRIIPFPVATFCRGKEEKPSFEIPEKFFFYPAQFWPHKNHICILEALKILKENFSLMPTIFFTGSDKGNKEYVQSKIQEYNLDSQVKITGFLKDEELKYLYTHATAMIFASLMGPNNMPPIEATYLNCPVIITDLDGHKEQLENSALYFNGYKPVELAKNMQKLLKSESAIKTLKSKQQKLSKEFDNINYFSEVKKILDEFSSIRKTWGKDYIPL